LASFASYNLEHAAARLADGAVTIALANNLGAPLFDVARHNILVKSGAEVIAGSTRMKAGTAQKIVLNLFSTAVMVKLGRVYRGLMVPMRARNAKLRRRAEMIVAEIVGCSPTRSTAPRAILRASLLFCFVAPTLRLSFCAIAVVLVPSRASVFNVFTSSFVHGRSFTFFPAAIGALQPNHHWIIVLFNSTVAFWQPFATAGRTAARLVLHSS
jgi:hypothetical protein